VPKAKVEEIEMAEKVTATIIDSLKKNLLRE